MWGQGAPRMSWNENVWELRKCELWEIWRWGEIGVGQGSLIASIRSPWDMPVSIKFRKESPLGFGMIGLCAFIAWDHSATPVSEFGLQFLELNNRRRKKLNLAMLQTCLPHQSVLWFRADSALQARFTLKDVRFQTWIVKRCTLMREENPYVDQLVS